MIIGQIKSKVGIDRDAWIELIALHPSLACAPGVKGINPFTRKPVEFKSNPASANVRIDDNSVGIIRWAEDESSMLIVIALDGREHAVVDIAKEIAIALDANFILGNT